MHRKVTAKGGREFASGIKRAQEIRADEKRMIIVKLKSRITFLHRMPSG